MFAKRIKITGRFILKIARYEANGQIHYGAIEGEDVKQLTSSPFENFSVSDTSHKLSDVKLLAPCQPGKILAIGLNYSSHLHDRPAPEEPMVFISRHPNFRNNFISQFLFFINKSFNDFFQ